jgi:tetratricopeptide (TPR) repeat protein
VAAAIVAWTVLLYARVAGHPFLHFDDNRYLTENPVVQRGLGLDGVAWAFTTFHASNWHPLTWLSHMADVQLFGMAPGPHHLVNVALHAANAVLLLLLLVRMTGKLGRCAAVAALFAVHPTHVESVAWVAERKDLLSTAFGLLALLAWVRYARDPRPRAYAAVAAAFALSLLAKPMWVTLPFLLLLLDAWPLGRWPVGARRGPPASLLVEKLPLLGLSIASSVVTAVAQARGGAVQGLDLGLGARVGNAVLSYGRYLAKTFWPSGLSIFYPHPGNEVPLAPTLASAVVLLALSAAALARLRRSPWLAVGWCWFLGTLVPVIGLVQVGAQAMADRYTYLPSIGLFVAIVWSVAEAAGERGARVLAAAGAVALAALSLVTAHQLGYWSSHERLFRRAVALAPKNGIAHGVLSEDLRHQGRLEEALAEAREAVRDAPGAANHWNNLAVTLHEVGRSAEAREALGEALRLDPAHEPSWLNLAMVAQELGDLPGAEAAALRATSLAPANAAAWFRLGLVRAAQGRLDEAAAAYQETVRRDPEHFGAWTNLAVLLQASGRFDEAGAAFGAATRAQPANPTGWRNLGVYLVNVGRPAEGSRAFREAFRLAPESVDVLRRLGLAQAAAGAYGEALQTADRLEGLDRAAAADLRARVRGAP